MREGDMGRSEVKIEARMALDKAIWLTHWGLYKDHTIAKWESKWTASHRPGQVLTRVG